TPTLSGAGWCAGGSDPPDVRTGTSINPAPWTEATRNDQNISCHAFRRIPTQRKCRRDSTCHRPAPTRSSPPTTATTVVVTDDMPIATAIEIAATEAK